MSSIFLASRAIPYTFYKCAVKSKGNMFEMLCSVEAGAVIFHASLSLFHVLRSCQVCLQKLHIISYSIAENEKGDKVPFFLVTFKVVLLLFL